jgi:glutamine synthetase
MYEKFGIFTKKELESRQEIIYETYAKSINIEALTMMEMAGKQIIPAVIEYSRILADTANSVKAAGGDASVETDQLGEISKRLVSMQKALSELRDAEKKASAVKDPRKQAFSYKDTVVSAMEKLRKPADELEMMVDKKIWPIPTYGDLMFDV